MEQIVEQIQNMRNIQQVIAGELEHMNEILTVIAVVFCLMLVFKQMH